MPSRKLFPLPPLPPIGFNKSEHRSDTEKYRKNGGGIFRPTELWGSPHNDGKNSHREDRHICRYPKQDHVWLLKKGEIARIPHQSLGGEVMQFLVFGFIIRPKAEV